MSKGPHSLEFILLGLLQLKPSTGYDLKKTMDKSIRFISPVALSQIYPTLKQLNAEELVEFQVEAREGKPDLKIYRVTPKGEAVFREWLQEPYVPDPYRFDYFTLRFSFSSMLPKALLIKYIRTELEFRREQALASQNFDISNLGELQPTPQMDMDRTTQFWALYHSYGIEFMKTYIRWLEQILDFAEQGSND
jgi:DNA-binding PadR family transcriptional regulator